MSDSENQQHHILIVDDDESMRFMLQTKLFQAGFSVTAASSGAHAIEIFQDGKRFDLVLSDLKMPLKNGIDVIRHMQDAGINAPIIILTGFPDKDKVSEAAAMGVTDIVVKPVRHHELMKIIVSKLNVAKKAS